MGCAKGTIKLLLHIFNLVIVIASLALIIIGVISLIKLKEKTNDIDTLTGPSIFLIVVGSIIFIIAFLGCCGAITENTCFLMLYGIILIILLVLQIAAGVYAFLEISDEDSLKDALTKSVKKAFDNYYTETASKTYLDILQSDLKCCGVSGPFNWGVNIPSSCCKGQTCLPITNVYTNGCANKLYSYIKDSADTIGYVALGLCIIEFVPAIFAFWLRSMI